MPIETPESVREREQRELERESPKPLPSAGFLAKRNGALSYRIIESRNWTKNWGKMGGKLEKQLEQIVGVPQEGHCGLEIFREI